MSFCVICGGEGSELHHVFPIHLGGDKDGPTVWLCGNHHSQIHKVATRLFRGKPIDVADDGEWLKNPGAVALIQRIIKAERDAEDRDLSAVASRLIIKIPKSKLKLIHRRKIDLGFKSLESYIMSLIDRDLPP
jgi:hypothetical protein